MHGGSGWRGRSSQWALPWWRPPRWASSEVRRWSWSCPPESAFRSARGHNDGHSDRTGFLIQRGPWEWAKIVQVRHFEQNTNTPTGCSERLQQPTIDMFCRAVPTTVPWTTKIGAAGLKTLHKPFIRDR